LQRRQAVKRQTRGRPICLAADDRLYRFVYLAVYLRRQ
jgi:hypothetical protein